jgi:hypothetical protein
MNRASIVEITSSTHHRTRATPHRTGCDQKKQSRGLARMLMYLQQFGAVMRFERCRARRAHLGRNHLRDRSMLQSSSMSPSRAWLIRLLAGKSETPGIHDILVLPQSEHGRPVTTHCKGRVRVQSTYRHRSSVSFRTSMFPFKRRFSLDKIHQRAGMRLQRHALSRSGPHDG